MRLKRAAARRPRWNSPPATTSHQFATGDDIAGARAAHAGPASAPSERYRALTHFATGWCSIVTKERNSRTSKLDKALAQLGGVIGQSHQGMQAISKPRKASFTATAHRQYARGVGGFGGLNADICKNNDFCRATVQSIHNFTTHTMKVALSMPRRLRSHIRSTYLIRRQQKPRGRRPHLGSLKPPGR
jgi:hypothetical protein